MAKPRLGPNDSVTRNMLDQAVEAILEGVDLLVSEVRGEVAGLRKEMNSSFDKLEVGQAHLKDQVEGLKADLSDTPSRREFKKLRVKVDKFHPMA